MKYNFTLTPQNKEVFKKRLLALFNKTGAVKITGKYKNRDNSYRLHKSLGFERWQLPVVSIRKYYTINDKISVYENTNGIGITLFEGAYMFFDYNQKQFHTGSSIKVLKVDRIIKATRIERIEIADFNKALKFVEDEEEEEFNRQLEKYWENNW